MMGSGSGWLQLIVTWRIQSNHSSVVMVSSDYQLGRIQNHLRDKHPDASVREFSLGLIEAGRRILTVGGAIPWAGGRIKRRK